MTQTTFDVVISGGGLSGTLMALSLAGLTKADGSLLSIAIIESQSTSLTTDSSTIQQQAQTTFDDRVLALSHGSAAYLKKVGAWQYLAADATAIEKIHISDRGYYGKARLTASDHNVSALGYVIEMAKIGNAQLKALTEKKRANQINVQWFIPDSISDIHWQVDHVDITLDSGTQLQTKLLLACDGANSVCRQQAKIDVNQSDYGQVALIANVATKNPHHNQAFERFTETGPIAMLPLSGVSSSNVSSSAVSKYKVSNRCSLVWTLTPELAKHMASLDDNAFKIALEQAFGSWLGEITHVGKRSVFPLILLQAQEQVFHRMALIGNASHTIHPIAGQGFNLGLRDVEYMSELISDTLTESKRVAGSKANSIFDIGSFSLLNHYAQVRQRDQNDVIALTDSLVTIFSNDLPPLALGRTIGLKVLNYVKPLKHALVRKTMGY